MNPSKNVLKFKNYAKYVKMLKYDKIAYIEVLKNLNNLQQLFLKCNKEYTDELFAKFHNSFDYVLENFNENAKNYIISEDFDFMDKFNYVNVFLGFLAPKNIKFFSEEAKNIQKKNIEFFIKNIDMLLAGLKNSIKCESELKLYNELLVKLSLIVKN